MMILRDRNRRRVVSALKILFGIGLSLLIAEVALRPFSSALSNRWLSIAQDDPKAKTSKEIRQYSEGVATCHFSMSRARLTGNAWIDGAPTVVLVGDSHVEAMHVRDEETLGAQLEDLARAANIPLNVRQYGWPGANPSTYVAVAADINRRWATPEVLVLLNDGDLGASAFADPSRFEVQVNGAVKAIFEDNLGSYRMRGPADWILRHSSLAYQLGRVALEVRGTHTATASVSERAPSNEESLIDIEVQQLKIAYGDRATVVYAPAMMPGNDTEGTQKEAALLRACEREKLRCFSEVPVLLAGQQTYSRFAHGAANMPPGQGHLNAMGYRLVAEDVWQRASKELVK